VHPIENKKRCHIVKSHLTPPLKINGQELVQIQEKCKKKGINGIRISDPIITQNALQNNLT
jgi:hypothetical protein